MRARTNLRMSCESGSENPSCLLLTWNGPGHRWPFQPPPMHHLLPVPSMHHLHRRRSNIMRRTHPRRTRQEARQFSRFCHGKGLCREWTRQNGRHRHARALLRLRLAQQRHHNPAAHRYRASTRRSERSRLSRSISMCLLLRSRTTVLSAYPSRQAWYSPFRHYHTSIAC